MPSYEHYLQAAERANTRRSYAAARKHFEESWGGLLPATPDAIARYLAAHAEQLALSTLQLRLAALGRWHAEHGFPDPTKTALVRRVLKGIAECHPPVAQRARPLALDTLTQLDTHVRAGRAAAQAVGAVALERRACRDRALVLIGFWKAFRADELLRLSVERIAVTAGEGMAIHLPRAKTVAAADGRDYKIPALSRLCPVQAYQDWIRSGALHQGPVFRRIGVNGALGTAGLHPHSVIAILRTRLRAAGVPAPEDYSGHSLRRGFATWASQSGWDTRALMEYVGWADVGSALRYVEAADCTPRERIEAGLAHCAPCSLEVPLTPTEADPKCRLPTRQR